MAAKAEMRSHVRQDAELPILIRPRGSDARDLLCWTRDVTPRGFLAEHENGSDGRDIEGQEAEVWLAPAAVPPNEWHLLGNARILRSRQFDSVTRTAVQFIGIEKKSLAIPQLVGESRVVHSVKAQLMQAAGCEFCVLITGETGTGKTLAAACIHQHSRGRDRPFIRVNCPNISPSLFESELFGHEKGAYTDAMTCTPGFFRVAGQGTILLDEISELDPSLQAKLLRVLDERVFVPVGGHQPVEVRCRIIATSNADLHARMKQGTFRQDLYYRLCEVPIHLPPLGERREDIPLLAEFLLRKHSKALRPQNRPELSIPFARSLAQRDWPGNVRELSNAMKQWLLGRPLQSCGAPASIVSQSAGVGGLDAQALVDRIRQHKGSLATLKREIVTMAESESIKAALIACGGNHTHAASMLGISYRTVARKLAQMNLTGTFLPTAQTLTSQDGPC